MAGRIVLAAALVLTVIAVWLGPKAARYYGLVPEVRKTAENFGISVLISASDYDRDGMDDYAELLLGAKKDAAVKPRYDGRYWSENEGYPPEDIGVCTDVIWRAFREAGYSLRDMLDRDIAEHPEDYPQIKSPDANIDFRRVVNLRAFFGKHAEELTLDTNDLEAWQPGDIVFFGEQHVGIVSDIRNADGKPWIVHNGGQPVREENFLARAKCTGHFRFNVKALDQAILSPWRND